MSAPMIKVGQTWWPLSTLSWERLPPTLPEYERHALAFCIDWLGGKNTYEFKTSGSTGLPKTITFKRQQLEASARLTQAALGLKAGETSLVCLDTRLIAGAMMLVRSMVTGMNIILTAPSSNPLGESKDTIDFVALVPYQLMSVLQAAPEKLNTIKNIIIGGAPLTTSTMNQLERLNNSIYATYGMTETISHIALQKLNEPHRQNRFECLPGITLHVDNRGCLVIEAKHLGPAPIITNDVIELIDPKTFKWLGRYDRVINSGGVKVSAEKVERAVESVLLERGFTSRFFVAGIPDTKFGEQVVLVIEDETLSPSEEDQLQKRLMLQLDKYELPRSIHYVPSFLETSSQKIDRLAILAILPQK